MMSQLTVSFIIHNIIHSEIGISGDPVISSRLGTFSVILFAFIFPKLCKCLKWLIECYKRGGNVNTITLKCLKLESRVMEFR